MKLYKSGLALKREGADETVAAFINEQDLDNVLEAVMTKKKPNKPVPGDEPEATSMNWSQQTAPGPDGYQRTVPGMPSAARDAVLNEVYELVLQQCTGMAAKDLPLTRILDAITDRKSIAAPDDDISPVYRWLEATASEEIAEVGNAARTLMAFYQGAEFPAPVQQAAPSDWSSAAEKVRTAVHGIIGEGFYLRLAELDFASIIASAAPAQPVGLNEQDKLDAAARLAYCVQHGFPQHLSTGWWGRLPNGNLVKGSGPIEAIDAAILAAKEAP